MAGNADVKVGDLLQTSGVDGIYPPGLDVAKVVKVDPRADSVVRAHRARAHGLGRRRAPRAGAPADGDAAAGAPRARARAGAAQGPGSRSRGPRSDHAARRRPAAAAGQPPVPLVLAVRRAGVQHAAAGPRPAMPDMLALVLVFWNVHQPRRVGIGAAFFFGLLMDVHQGAVLGQHAQAYTLLSFLAITMHRRLLWFRLAEQALQILPVFIVAHAVSLVVRLLSSGSFPGWTLLLAPRVRGPAVARRSRGCCWRRNAAPPTATRTVPCKNRLGPVKSMTELRNIEVELDRFRTRTIAAAAFVLLCFGLLVFRWFVLQVVRHDDLQAQAEANRIGVVPIVPNRGLIVDRNGIVMATNYPGLHAGDHAVQGGRRGGHDQRDRQGHRGDAARPQALRAAGGRRQELRVGAHPHQAHRRGGGALRGAALPLPGRRDQGAAVPQLPARRARQPPGGLHRPHQPGRKAEDRRRLVGRGPGQLPRHRVHRQAGPGAELRVRAARHHRLRADRDLGRRPRRAPARQQAGHAGQHAAAVDRHPAAGARRGRCTATAAARWWRSIRATARCWPSSPSPRSTPTCSSTASMPTTGRT